MCRKPCFCFSINKFTIANNFLKVKNDFTDVHKRPEAAEIMEKKTI